MKRCLPFPSHFTLPFLESRSRLTAVSVLLLGCYLGSVTATIYTSRVDVDEAAFANPCYNLLHHGFMGTTLYAEHGLMPTGSLTHHTYWNPPLFFLNNTVVFAVFGIGIFQVRFVSLLWGLVALASWYVLLRSGRNSPGLSLVITGFIGLGYFFQLGSASGRMDMMCLALGTASLASYLALRHSNLVGAVILSNALAAASVLTHAVGIAYFCGLLYLTVFLDLRNVRFQHVALAAIPYLLGAAGWGAYISKDPAGFLEQMRGNVSVTKASVGLQSASSPADMLRVEIVRRYQNPFGLGPGATPVTRTKSVVLIAYIVGLLGILLVKRLRDDRFLHNIVVVGLINFCVLAFVATSKNSYYLPHTTAIFSAAFALFALRLPRPGSLGQGIGLSVLIGLVALQLTGLAIRDHADELHSSYLAAVDSVRTNSPRGSLIFGSADLWLQLTPDREVVHDWTLGYESGRRAALVVTTPILREIMEQARIDNSSKFAHASAVLSRAQKVYDDGYYMIYLPHY
jgi:4-amino-4-deoxy-L-arabinose transferase-like glycosyltransferase